MRSQKLFAAFLLGVGLCFVPVLGQGTVHEWMDEHKPSVIDFHLLEAKVDYIMQNPTNFLIVRFIYDRVGTFGRIAESGKDTGFIKLPKGADTKGKILVMVFDSRGVFSHKSQTALLNQFKKELDLIYVHLFVIASNMDTDIVASFWGREAIIKDIPLGYFYQGEYHLWGK